MTTAVRTPLDHTRVLVLGNKRYRKELLRVGELHYQGGTFNITPEYLDAIVASFDAGAIKRVPFQLADADNRHTQDPLRRFGTVVGLRRTPTGLDGVIELNDAAAQLVDEDPEALGVSVLVHHDRTTGEGQRFDAVLAHVLGTTDPVVTSLAPWAEEELAAANTTSGGVLDLLALSTSSPSGNTEGANSMAETLTSEELGRLRALLAKQPDEPAAPATPVVTPTPPADAPVEQPGQVEHHSDDDRDLTDEELAEIAAAVEDDPADTTPAPETVAAAQPGDEGSLGLAHDLAAERAKRETLELSMRRIQEELDQRNYLTERDHLAREFGVPPRCTEILRPILQGSGRALALANGQDTTDAELVRRFVTELAATGFLDLAHPTGSTTGVDTTGDGDSDEQRRRFAEDYITTFNLR